MRRALVLVAISLLALAAGCERQSGGAAGAQPAVATSTTPAGPASAPAGKPAVATIAFVGKQHACECTQKAIDASWKALAAGLGAKNRIPVTRLQADTQPDQVAPHRARRPFLALPAIYFLDRQDGLVELLQGEVTEAQVRAVLR